MQSRRTTVLTLMRRLTTKQKIAGIKHGFRSGLEERIASELDQQSVPYKYEQRKITYVKPARTSTYTPDFELPNGVIVETKGRFLAEDRQKHLLVKQQNPELDIRFVFSNSKTPIFKGSKTSYGDWCLKHGFPYADKHIPNHWLH